MKTTLMKRRATLILLLLVLFSFVVACGTAAQPEVREIIVTREVEREVVVTREVEVEREVVVTQEVIVTQEVQVETIVEREVVVTATPAPGGGQVIYALYQEPQILNPFIATQTASGEVNSMIVEGLLGVNPDGQFYPVLAKEVPTVGNGQVTPDGLQVTYNLREDILWSDGTPFTCNDVLFTFRAVMHPLSGAVSTSGYDKLELPADYAAMMADPEAEVEEDPSDGGGVVCLDDYTVQLNFTEFYAPYLSLFISVMPEHATGEPADMQRWVYNWNPMGTGPFVMQQWVSGDSIRLVKNENYRDYPEKPNLDQVIVRIIPSREVGKALIRTGEIDILWDLSEADIPEFEGINEVVVNARPGPGTERLVLNLADPELDATDDPLNNPHWALGDVRVRQAIQYAIDKDFINEELLYGLAKPGTSELNIGWAQADLPESEYNPEMAATLLDEAGFTDADGDGVRECNGCLYAEDGRALRLKIQTTTGNQLREETQQLLGEMLTEVGVELYIENVPSSVLFGSWASGAFRKHGQYDILMYTTSDGVDPHSQVNGYFASDQMPLEANGGLGFNYSRWVNEEADEYIAQAGASPDLEERRAAYQRVMEIIAEELPHIYLYDRSEIHLSRDHVLGFEVNPWDNQSWNAADWAIQQ